MLGYLRRQTICDELLNIIEVKLMLTNNNDSQKIKKQQYS